MQNNKAIIKTIRIIYEVDVAIANQHTTLAQLRKRFTHRNGAELTEEITDCEATTTLCKNKKTNRTTILVKHNRPNSCKDIDKKLNLINVSAHEAVHVMLDIYWAIGDYANLDSQEPTAYFIGWMTEEIYKVFKT